MSIILTRPEGSHLYWHGGLFYLPCCKWYRECLLIDSLEKSILSGSGNDLHVRNWTQAISLSSICLSYQTTPSACNLWYEIYWCLFWIRHIHHSISTQSWCILFCKVRPATLPLDWTGACPDHRHSPGNIALPVVIISATRVRNNGAILVHMPSMFVAHE